jgi:hypothetical protein
MLPKSEMLTVVRQGSQTENTGNFQVVESIYK